MDSVSLIERTVLELAREDDRCVAKAAEWDSRLADLSSTLKSPIPASVQERCAAARQRINCGLIAAAQHAWASADDVLYIWDYRREDPPVLLVPADSPIISMAICPPRPGVFECNVHLVIVLCTRLTVSLVGVHLTGSGDTANQFAAGQVEQSSGVRLIHLEGYSTRVDGSCFHTVRHTADGTILLGCGAPQIYELSYSRTPGWFQSKCRLIRHSAGLLKRVRDFFSVGMAAGFTGRIRLLQCTLGKPSTTNCNYVFTVDDASTVRLFRIRDQAVHRLESIAALEEIAVLTATDMTNQVQTVTAAPLQTTAITNIFPTIGLDGHLRLHMVTAASERFFFVCSADSPRGPSSSSSAREPGPCRLHFGFWLQRSSSLPQRFDAVGNTPMQYGAPSERLDENGEPCLHAAGVWIAAVRVAGIQGAEINIAVRLDPGFGCGNMEALDLHTTMRFESQVLDIIEECHVLPGMVSPGGGPRTGAAQVGLPDAPLDGEPSAFRGSRSFAILLADAVQVFTLSFKAQSINRPPETAAECCLHLGQLSLPPLNSVDASALPEPQWPWSFDDARAPSFEEQLRDCEQLHTLPALHFGRWFHGLLRFLSIVLRPSWGAPLVSPVFGRQFMDLRFLDVPRVGLCLTLTEGKVQRLLARIRPVVHFARQALASQGQASTPSRKDAPPCVAARSRLYSTQRTSDAEGPAQVRELLQGVLDVADRVQQVLGLVNILISQRSAYRVLQSDILAGPTLESLMTLPLGQLVATSDTLAPLGRLCTALIIESGLPTPSTELVFDANKLGRSNSLSNGRQWQDPISGCGVADRSSWGAQKGQSPHYGPGPTLGRGAAHEVCRELEKQCPIIFALVDLDLCYTQSLSQGTAAAAATPGDVLSRCVQCVSSSSVDDRWDVLTNSMRTLAAEDMRGAAEICLDKLHQLQQGKAAGASSRAKVLLEALLSVLNPQPEKQSCALIEYLLSKTSALRFAEDEGLESQGSRAVPFMHEVILDYLLNNSRVQRLLDVLLDTSPVKVEAFLKDRCDKSRLASEFLWKYYLRHGRSSCASDVLLHLAEWAGSDASFGLAERGRCLDMARQAAQRAMPRSKDAVDRLTIKLDVAVRVQVPLCQELRLIAADARLAARWRSAAELRRKELERLQGLQTLYQAAVDFGLFHLVLVITNLSSSVQEQVDSSSNWVSMFFPPVMSPYSPSELQSGEPRPRLEGLFPLLMVRRCATFFPQNDSASMLPGGTSPDEFRVRASRLLEELSSLTKAPSTMWDVRCIGTLLEYCNCLWLNAQDKAEHFRIGEAADAATDLDQPTPDRVAHAWVALEVMPGRPFEEPTANVVKLYADMITYLPKWLADLRGMLPSDEVRSRPSLTEDDLCLHVCKVFVTVVDLWTRRVEEARGDEHAFAEFQRVWPLAEGILAGFTSGASMFSSSSSADHPLAEEARRLEERARARLGVQARRSEAQVQPAEEALCDQKEGPGSSRPAGSSLFSRSFLAPPPLPAPCQPPPEAN